MAEYIDREALSKAFLTEDEDVMVDFGPNYGTQWVFSQEAIKKVIGSIPTADVAPVVHGRWELLSEHRSHKCSVCGRRDWYATNYCPNCGAKMDLETDNVPGSV